MRSIASRPHTRRLARLPSPHSGQSAFEPLIRRVIGLETRLPVALSSAPDVTVSADPDQLEQLLINLVQNAVDAALEAGGGVRASWAHVDSTLEVRIEDEGPGLHEHRESVCSVLHDKAGRFGHWPGSQPTDRRSAWRHVNPPEPRGWQGHDSHSSHSGRRLEAPGWLPALTGANTQSKLVSVADCSCRGE